MAQLDNAADSDSEERGFESLWAGHEKSKSKDLLFSMISVPYGTGDIPPV